MIELVLWSYIWCLTSDTTRCTTVSSFRTETACIADIGALRTSFANPPTTMPSDKQALSRAAAVSLWLYNPCRPIHTGGSSDCLTAQ